MWTEHAEFYTLYLIHRSNAGRSEHTPQCSIHSHFPISAPLNKAENKSGAFLLGLFQACVYDLKDEREYTFIFPY